MAFKVTALQPQGRWRCQQFWPASGKTVDVLTEAQLAALDADPLIRVEDIADAPKAKKSKSAEKNS
jgi:hypothetical protein